MIFDILNGYLQDVPQVFLETIIKCLLIGALFAVFKKSGRGDDRKNGIPGAMICTVLYGCMNILMSLLWGLSK